MAEAVFIHLVRGAGLENAIKVDSAGTGNWHVGQPAHAGTRHVLREQGIEYSGCGRQLTADDLDNFDYIVTMDNQNLCDVRAMQDADGEHRAQIAPLLSYAPQTKMAEVPDPYISGGFDVVFRLVHAGCSGLLEEIRREHLAA